MNRENLGEAIPKRQDVKGNSTGALILVPPGMGPWFRFLRTCQGLSPEAPILGLKTLEAFAPQAGVGDSAPLTLRPSICYVLWAMRVPPRALGPDQFHFLFLTSKETETWPVEKET